MWLSHFIMISGVFVTEALSTGVLGVMEGLSTGVVIPFRSVGSGMNVTVWSGGEGLSVGVVVLSIGSCFAVCKQQTTLYIIHIRSINQLPLWEYNYDTCNKDRDLRVLLWDKVGIDTRDRDCHITVVRSIVIQLNISNSQRFVQWVHTVLSLWSCGIKSLKSFPPTEWV